MNRPIGPAEERRTDRTNEGTNVATTEPTCENTCRQMIGAQISGRPTSHGITNASAYPLVR